MSYKLIKTPPPPWFLNAFVFEGANLQSSRKGNINIRHNPYSSEFEIDITSLVKLGVNPECEKVKALTGKKICIYVKTHTTDCFIDCFITVGKHSLIGQGVYGDAEYLLPLKRAAHVIVDLTNILNFT